MNVKEDDAAIKCGKAIHNFKIKMERVRFCLELELNKKLPPSFISFWLKKKNFA